MEYSKVSKNIPYKVYLGGVDTIYIDKFWKDNAEYIIKQLFVLQGWFITLQNQQLINIKGYGDKLLTVEYKNTIYQLKLPNCQSHKMKRQICHL